MTNIEINIKAFQVPTSTGGTPEQLLKELRSVLERRCNTITVTATRQELVTETIPVTVTREVTCERTVQYDATYNGVERTVL